jgi:hypothetical protein
MSWNDDVERALHDADLRERADLRWLGVAASLAPKLATDGAAALRAAVPDFEDALAAAPLAPGALARAAEVAASAPAPFVVGLGLLLSASRPERADERRERALTAAALFEAALRASPAVAIAVRLARLRAELGDDVRAQHAWTEALRRDLALAWLPPPDLRSRADFDAVERAALDASPPDEEAARDALRAARQGAGRARLEALVAAGDAPPLVHVALAAEHLRDLARARFGSPDAQAAIAGTKAALRGLAGSPPVAVLEAVLAILERRRSDAAASLARVGAADRAAAAAAADAVGELVRRPPHDVGAVLAAAYFDALFDPLTALDVPRGLLSAYRKLVLRTVLGAMMAGPLGPVASALASPGAPADLQAAIVMAVHGNAATSTADVHSAHPKGEDRAAPGDYFHDADDLGKSAAVEEAVDLGKTLRSLVRADLSDADADALLRAFAHTKGADRDELRIALAEALSDPEISSWIDASPSRIARALDVVKRVAPRDPSHAENRDVNKRVEDFKDWESFRYDVIIVTGYTPSDLKTPTPGVHPVAKQRLEDALTAYKRGDAPFILVSGGNVYPRGTPYYEAIEMKRELVRMGAPADAIIVDAQARHSTTNLRNAGRYMLAHGLSRAVIAARGGGAGPFDQTWSAFGPQWAHGDATRRLDSSFSPRSYHRRGRRPRRMKIQALTAIFFLGTKITEASRR